VENEFVPNVRNLTFLRVLRKITSRRKPIIVVLAHKNPQEHFHWAESTDAFLVVREKTPITAG
jgi:hypothetical protein